MGTCPHSTAPQRQGKKWQFWAPTARALPGCLGKLGSLEWQLQDTQPVRRLPLWTPLPLLLGLEKTQREAEETLSPKPNSSRSLLSKRLLRLPGFHSLPPRPPGTTGSFLHPTARSCPHMSRFCLSIPKCRSLLKGPPATSTCLSRGSPRWEPERAPHAPLTPPLQSLKRSSLCPATPAPAPAPPGGPLCSVTQAAFSERPRPENYALLRLPRTSPPSCAHCEPTDHKPSATSTPHPSRLLAALGL